MEKNERKVRGNDFNFHENKNKKSTNKKKKSRNLTELKEKKIQTENQIYFLNKQKQRKLEIIFCRFCYKSSNGNKNKVRGILKQSQEFMDDAET